MVQTTSGTYTFDLPVADILFEAFDRCEKRGTALTRNDLRSAIRSLNLELQSWGNRGVDLWSVTPFTVQIVAAQATYVAGAGVTNISPNTVSMLDVYYSTLGTGPNGGNTDRILLPLSRTDYDQLPNKSVQGTPNSFWYDKLTPGSQSLTLYQVPNVGYPTAVISGHYLSRMQDARLAGGQIPDVPYLFLDALCAKLAQRLAVKFNPAKYTLLKAEADEAWMLAAETDREDVPITLLPAVQSLWGRD